MTNTMRIFAGMLFLLVLLATACQPPEPDSLPILGERDFVDGDTIYHTIPDFAFINQDSELVTNETFAGKVYVADFFFIHCPTICPKTAREMKKIQDHFIDDDRVMLLAHTVDPVRDTVGALKRYANNLHAKPGKWHFVTGDKDAIYKIADDYFSIAMEDPDAPGGFDHSGRLILVDSNRHIRSFCNGTDPKDVDRFIEDIERLLKAEYSRK
ncbi:MAG: SCO family protein [Saprospiraceae bacterium]